MSDRLPAISLVTPSFNQADYLETTLVSVLEQRYPHLEYIVVDAASTDGSVDIIRRYADGLSFWVSEPDGGHTDGLNKGFARSGGEVMGWINSSDVHFPWTLRCVGEVFRDLPEVQWIMGLQTNLSDDGVPRQVTGLEWNLHDFLAGNYRWLQQESVFWRRGLWDRAGGRIDPDVRFACDFSLWLAFMRQAPLYHVPVPLGGFRHHEVRRGDPAHGEPVQSGYDDESRALWEDWVAGAPVRERRRSRLIGSGTGRRGRMWRDVVEGSGIAPWYRHRRVSYDFLAGAWVAE